MRKTWLPFFACFGFLFLLLEHQASAGDFQGKLVLNPSFIQTLEKEAEASDNSVDFYWNEPNGILSVAPPTVDFPMDMAVVLVPPSPTVAPPDELVTVLIKNADLEKDVIVVHKGTNVRFRNEEPFVHELFSPQIPDFKPEMQSTNAVRQVTFDNLGIFEIRCKRMPHFLSYVVVVATPFVAKLTEQGEFSFTNLTPGEYTLQVFYQGKWIHELKVNVEDKKTGPITVELKSPQGPPVEEQDKGKV